MSGGTSRCMAVSQNGSNIPHTTPSVAADDEQRPDRRRRRQHRHRQRRQAHAARQRRGTAGAGASAARSRRRRSAPRPARRRGSPRSGRRRRRRARRSARARSAAPRRSSRKTEAPATITQSHVWLVNSRQPRRRSARKPLRRPSLPPRRCPAPVGDRPQPPQEPGAHEEGAGRRCRSPSPHPGRPRAARRSPHPA